ncbi:CHAP domain-containing protein [bacterium]|nr:CHAP domain-containing protein [bacterium]
MASIPNISTGTVQTVAPTPRQAPAQNVSPAQFASQAADRTLGAPTNVGTVQTSATADTGAPVLKYAQDKKGTVDGNGECFTLADEALKQNGMKSASDYGRVTPNADYKWGKPVPLNESKPGDVLQFRNYENTTRDTKADGSWNEETNSRPHHTAIVVSNDGKGNITVLEQNAPEGSPVTERVLHFGNGTAKNEDGSSQAQKTKGVIKAYHPEPK